MERRAHAPRSTTENENGVLGADPRVCPRTDRGVRPYRTFSGQMPLIGHRSTLITEGTKQDQRQSASFSVISVPFPGSLAGSLATPYNP